MIFFSVLEIHCLMIENLDAYTYLHERAFVEHFSQNVNENVYIDVNGGYNINIFDYEIL